MQAAVKAGLYPLFGILTLSEKAHFLASGGEIGSLASGATASMMIGAVYLWPATVSRRLQGRFTFITKISIVIIFAALAITVVGIITGNPLILAFSTPLLVVSIASASAMAIGKLAKSIFSALCKGRY